MTKLILLAALTTTWAGAQTPALLSMNCHLLFRGVPMAETTTYSVVGRELVSKSDVGTTRLSTEGALLPLGRSVDKGVVTNSSTPCRPGRVLITR